MEVQFTPDVQARLDQPATETGCPQGKFIEDALAGYFEELAQVRRTLDTRYDDLQSGKVKLLFAEEVLARMHERSAARRSSTLREYAFHPEAVVDLEEIWDFIAQGSPDAADRAIPEILARLKLPHQCEARRIDELISPDARSASCMCMSTSSPMPIELLPFGS